MKTSNNKHKTFVLGNKGAAVLIITAILALVFTGCNQPAGGKSDGGPTPPPSYKKVAYDNLENYMRDTASSTETNYIEVTGDIGADKFKGSTSPVESASPLGKILQKYPAKKVALKIAKYPAGLTDMSYCFYECKNLVGLANLPTNLITMDRSFADCKSLITVADIPASVKNMQACFHGCIKLTGVKLKCDYNPEVIGNKAFSYAFYDCKAFTSGSIKVPANFYNNYIEANALDTMKVPGSTYEEKKAKFAPYTP